ncbi:MAG: hypothetical protein ACLGP3_02990 [Acidobacteriota bacterium]
MGRQVLRGIPPASAPGWAIPWRVAGVVALSALLVSGLAAQVITIDTSGRGATAGNGPVDKQYQQIEPTQVALPTQPMGSRDRLQLMRVMQAEQGFAMRPLPRGHKGLTLEANGKLDPAGVGYLNLVISNGLSVKPGQRVVITDVKVDKNKLIFDVNDGPDGKHRFLRHISIGTDPYYDMPVVADDGDPGGARITLAFKNRIPALTGDQVKALLAPLVSFDVKTPVQAYTDTLPKPLKDAILNHEVLVGMNLDMLMFAKGQPQTKYHEMEGQMPVDIWLYGKPPQDVTFVRINGNRVIRVEVARIGKPTQVFTQDVVSPMLRGTGAVLEQAQNVRVIQEGDVHRNPDTQMPAPPPTLRNPGETLPDEDKSAGEMKPVHFPKPQPDDSSDASQGSSQPDSPPSSAPAPAAPSPAGAGAAAQSPSAQGPSAQPGSIPPASEPK